MDTRLAEFQPIRINKYVPELDILNNPLLEENEKRFLEDFYEFLENELDAELRKLEELNYHIQEPIEEKKKELVVGMSFCISLFS